MMDRELAGIGVLAGREPGAERELVSTQLAFVVRLLDEFSPQSGALVGDVRWTLDPLEPTFAPPGPPAVRLSAVLLSFVDLAAGNYMLRSWGTYYFSVEKSIPYSKIIDPSVAILTVGLKPRPSYPFPQNATLIRGVVSDSFGLPLAGVTVRAERVPASGAGTSASPGDTGGGAGGSTGAEVQTGGVGLFIQETVTDRPLPYSGAYVLYFFEPAAPAVETSVQVFFSMPGFIDQVVMITLRAHQTQVCDVRLQPVE